MLNLNSAASLSTIPQPRAAAGMASANQMLASMPAASRRLLAPHLREIRVKRGELLIQPGVAIQHIWFPHDCVISVLMMLENGACAETCTIGREGMMGFVSSLGDGRSTACGVARIGGTATRIDRARFAEVFEACPEWRRHCLRYAGLMIAQILQSVACNAHHSVEARLARQILILHDRVERANLPVTHDYLAEMLGSNRSTVTLAAKLLQREGLIEQRRGAVVVRRRRGLEAAACECYRAVRNHFERLLPANDPIVVGR